MGVGLTRHTHLTGAGRLERRAAYLTGTQGSEASVAVSAANDLQYIVRPPPFRFLER